MTAAVPAPGRGDAREQAILATTYELLAVVGYERLTMDAVAEHAHASKTTIYRRWPNKAAMVVAAFAAMDPAPTTELDTGTLRGDLLALLRAVRERLTGKNLSRMSSLMFAMQTDPELAQALRAYFLPIRAALTRDLLDRAGAREEVARGLDPGPLRDLTIGVLLARLLVTGEPVDDPYLDQLVDGILLPMLRT